LKYYIYCLLALTDDYQSAREKCAMAQFTSDLDTQASDVERS